MPENQKKAPSALPGSSPEAEQRDTISSRLEHFEKRQSEIWRITFFLLLVLSVVFAVVSWDWISSLAHNFKALPIGLVLLVSLFGLYAWKRTQEISELRGVVRGIEARDAAPPSERQLDQLFTVIARSQQGYRDLIDSFEDILLALTLDGEIRAVNRSFADLVGLSFQQIIGRPVSDFIEEGNGEGPDLVARAMPRFLERRHWSGLLQIRLKNQKSVFYFDCVAHAMTRGDEVHGITLLARDITALRKNEVRFTELFETLQEGIYIATPDDRLVDANPALVRMLGYGSKEELLSRTLPEILPDQSQRLLLRQEVDRESVVQGREVTLFRKDGSALVCLNTAAAVRDPTGHVVRYHGALIDITERREMERRLHQQQEFARRLVDSFPDLILVFDAVGKNTFTSPRIVEILGYSSFGDNAKDLMERTHIEDRPGLRSLFGSIAEGKETFGSLEVRMRHHQGEWKRIRWNFSPLSDENGKIDGVILSGRDVTELKRLEEKLIQSEKLAAMGQMLAGVAHELNNPLTAILGVTELLREQANLDSGSKRQLDLTHRQARRAARIVQNLLEFSRPAALQKTAVDINGIVDRTLQLHDHSLRRNSIEVDFQPQAGLPFVVGDSNQLVQVFLNLLSNAEQAIREVRDNGRIQIRVGRLGSHLSVTIQDDGVGISSDALPKIFDPFYTTKRPGGGTGLGLSICLSIIREHGGTIDVETLPAGGSAFTVYLPVAPSGQTQAPPPVESRAFPVQALLSATDILRDRSVLVLDDEEGIRTSLAEGLARYGLAVDGAATPEEAVVMVRNRSYDAVLCDLNLGSDSTVVSGQDVWRRMLTEVGDPKPAVIFMSGDLTEFSAPAGGYSLQKPFRIADVLGILRTAIQDADGRRP